MRGDVEDFGGGVYFVAGYEVFLCGEDDLWDGECNCHDFYRYGSIFGRPCKHLWAVKISGMAGSCG